MLKVGGNPMGVWRIRDCGLSRVTVKIKTRHGLWQDTHQGKNDVELPWEIHLQTTRAGQFNWKSTSPSKLLQSNI